MNDHEKQDRDWERYAGSVLKELYPEVRSAVPVPMRTPRSFRTLHAALAAACVLALVGAVVLIQRSTQHGPAGSQGSVTASATVTPSYDTPPAGWATEGRRIVAAKRSAGAAHPEESPANAGAYAYASQPVDVTRDGSITLIFGPIAPQYRRAVTKVASFNFPHNTPAQFDLNSPLHLVTRNGNTYVAGTFRVAGLTRPYHDLVAYIY